MSAPFTSKPPISDVIREMHQMLVHLKPRTGTPLSDVLPTHAARAKEVYMARRRRQDFFPEVGDLFHEPVWDILLDLFIAGERGDYISVSSACIGSAVPSTTALRVLKLLEDREVVVIESDPFDKRRRFVKLSQPVNKKMVEYLSAIDLTRVPAP